MRTAQTEKGTMMRALLVGIAACAMAFGAPLAAQDSTDDAAPVIADDGTSGDDASGGMVEAQPDIGAALMGGFGKILADLFTAPDLTPEQEARLPAATSAAATILPDGIYRQAMEQSLGGMLGKLFATFGGERLTNTDLVKKLGVDWEAIERLDEEQRARLSTLIDPAHAERQKKTGDAIMAVVGDMFSTVEPAIRDGLSKAYAARFTDAQLADINAFFATDSGKAFAGQAMLSFTDPQVMQATMKALPAMLGGFVTAKQKMDAATADLPKEKDFDTLTPAERKEIATALGIDVRTLEDNMRAAAEAATMSGDDWSDDLAEADSNGDETGDSMSDETTPDEKPVLTAVRVDDGAKPVKKASGPGK